MQTFLPRFLCQTATAILMVLCSTSDAQEVSLFLRDVIRGSPQARDQIEHRIHHLQEARELASRTLLLNKCVNFREPIRDPRFDAFAEALLKDLSSPDPDALTNFTVSPRLEEAAIQNGLTDAQIEVIARITRSPRYGEFVDYLSFERAESKIAAGFTEVNTGEKAPWIASSALSFLRQSQFFPLLLKNSSEPDRALLNKRLLDDVSPSQQITDDAYLEALTKFFKSQLDSGSLRAELPTETKSLLTLYESLGIDAMRVGAFVSTQFLPEAQTACKSKNRANCVDGAWLAAGIALKKQLETTQYKTASLILKDQFADVCRLKLD
jgi:hypothetical protein